MENGMYNSGFERTDWYLLRDAVLAASNADSKDKYHIFDLLPDHLRASPVGEFIFQAVYLGQEKAVENAAAALTGDAENPWLVLMKP